MGDGYDVYPCGQDGWAHLAAVTTAMTNATQLAIQAVLASLEGFLSALKATAEQWTDAEHLRAILTRAFAKFMLTTAGPRALPTSETAAI